MWMIHTFSLDKCFWLGLGWCHMKRSKQAETPPKSSLYTSCTARFSDPVCRLMTLDRIDTELAFEAAAEPSPSPLRQLIQAQICTT